MPAQQEIVHWYNRVPDIANGDIPGDYPITPDDYPIITDYSDMVNRSFHDDYPANRITELRDLLDRLCNDIGSVTYDISNGVINIVARGLPNSATYLFSLQQWLTDEREVKRYLREWFPSFSIPYTMGGLANYIHSSSSERERLLCEIRERVSMKVTPSPCTGKEEASDINYLDVI